MDQVEFDILLDTFNGTAIHSYLTSSSADYELTYSQLFQLITKYSKQEYAPSNLIKLLSYRLIQVLPHTNKLFELANTLANNLSTIQDSITSHHKISILLLIDMFKTFSHQLVSISDFTLNLIYSKIKKNASLSHYLIVLSSHIIKLSSNEKVCTKLIKLSEKQISTSDQLFIKHYTVLLSKLLIKSVGVHFVSLQSKKLAPANLLAQQKQFQLTLLTKYNTLFINGLLSDREIKLASINMIINLLDSFVPTEFNSFNYLIDLYQANPTIGVEIIIFYINFSLHKRPNYLMESYQGIFDYILDNPHQAFKPLLIECLSNLSSMNDLLLTYFNGKLKSELLPVQYSLLFTFINYIDLKDLEPILMNLLIHQNELIRIESRYYLVNFFTQEYQINKLLLKLFTLFTDLLNKDPSQEYKLSSYSITIAMVFKQKPTSFYQNSIIFKILSFTTQNLKNPNTNKKQYITNYNCWILLNGLLNLNNELIVIQKSQFLIFWKNFLKSNDYSSTEINLRKVSLYCLLNFIDNFKINNYLPQIINLLNKSLAYATSFKTQFNLKDVEIGEANSLQENYVEFLKILIGNYLKLSYNYKVELNSNLILLCTRYITEDLNVSSKLKNGELLIKYDLADMPLLVVEDEETWLDNAQFQQTKDKLYQDYSTGLKYEPDTMTTIIDYSVEILGTIFPNLSLKIQLSLLEQLRSFTTSKKDSESLKINVSLIISGIVKQFHSKRIKLNKQTSDMIVDTLSKIDLFREDIIDLNAESLSLLLVCLDDKEYITEIIQSKVGEIVETVDPFKRSILIFQIAKIYELNFTQFPVIYDIMTKLILDPNPVIHYWCLKSIVIVLENHLNNLKLIPVLLRTLEKNYLDDSFGLGVYSNTNLKMKFNHWGWFAKIIKIVIVSVGPNLRSLPEDSLSILKNLIVGLSLGVGAELDGDYNLIFENLVILLKELFIFDPSLVTEQYEFTIDLYLKIILENLNIHSSHMPQVTFSTSAVFITSTRLYKSSISSCVELLKLKEIEISDDKINSLFTAMNKKPVQELSKLISVIFSSPRFDIDYIINYYKKSAIEEKTQVIQESNDDEDDKIIEQDKELAKVDLNNCDFKLLIIDLLKNKIEQEAKINEVNIQEIIKIVFQSCNSSNTDINLKGIELLSLVFEKLGDKVDPLYPNISILEQQQAQIISSLSALYKSNLSKIIIETINVSSTFINLPRIKISSKTRILNNLIDILEETAASKFNKLDKFIEFSEINLNYIKLSILNCWAIVKIKYYNNEEKELEETLDKYTELLISLWIQSLREYSMIKYNNETNIENYKRYWVNYCNILCFEINNNKEFMVEILGDELYKFFFVLFSQCIESLIKNEDSTRVLEIVYKLIDEISPDLIFNDEFFGEIIDLFDRLILINRFEDKLMLVKICEKLFKNYIDAFKIDENFDKLFEMIRVVFLPIFSLLPFTADIETMKNLNENDIVLLSQSFKSLLEMINKLPAVIQIDIYSCALEILFKIYEYESDPKHDTDLVSHLLIYLKKIIIELKSLNQSDIIAIFRRKIGTVLPISKRKSSILTYFIIIINGEINLDDEDTDKLIDNLVELGDENPQLSIQCIKSIIQFGNNRLLSKIIPKLVKSFIHNSSIHDFESLHFFMKSLEASKIGDFYSILIPILLNSRCDKIYKHEKLIELIKYKPDLFKVIVKQNLTESQKIDAESLVKLNQTETQAHTDTATHIQLKKFGSS